MKSIPPLGLDFETSKPTLEALIEASETGQRIRADVLNSYVKVSDLVDHKILRLGRNNALLAGQPTYADPVMQNSWARYGDPFPVAGYYKDPYGRVFVRGLVSGGALGTVIFTLPAGFRPQYRMLFATLANDAAARVDVNQDGQVIHVSGSTVWMSLDTISFLAVQ